MVSLPPRASVLLSRRAIVAMAALGALGAKPVSAGTETPIRFLLSWRFEGLAALFLVAQEKGYFRDEGLAVSFEAGTGARQVPARVAAGEFDVGCGDVSALMRFRDANTGQDPKAVMMIHDRAPFAVIGRRSRGISDEPASLEGKKIGAPAADAAFAQWPVFKNLTRIDDSRIRLENIGFPVREPMLASGEVDAIFGFGSSSLASLKARGVPAEDIVVMTMADHGFLPYGNAILTSPKLAASNPEAVRGLLRAVVRGIRDVTAHPDLGVQAITRRNDNAQADIERERLISGLEQNVLTPYVKENGLGGVDPARWTAAMEQGAKAQPFRDKARAGDAFTDAFLPAKDDRLF